MIRYHMQYYEARNALWSHLQTVFGSLCPLSDLDEIVRLSVALEKAKAARSATVKQEESARRRWGKK
jgi:hypothetical protein